MHHVLPLPLITSALRGDSVWNEDIKIKINKKINKIKDHTYLGHSIMSCAPRFISVPYQRPLPVCTRKARGARSQRLMFNKTCCVDEQQATVCTVVVPTLSHCEIRSGVLSHEVCVVCAGGGRCACERCCVVVIISAVHYHEQGEVFSV